MAVMMERVVEADKKGAVDRTVVASVNMEKAAERKATAFDMEKTATVKMEKVENRKVLAAVKLEKEVDRKATAF